MFTLAEIHASVKRLPQDQNVCFENIPGGTLEALWNAGFPIAQALIIFYDRDEQENQTPALKKQFSQVKLLFDAGGDGFDKTSLPLVFADELGEEQIIVTGSHYGSCHTTLLLRLEDFFRKKSAGNSKKFLKYHLILPLIGSKDECIPDKIQQGKEVNMSYFSGQYYLDGVRVGTSREINTHYYFWTTLRSFLVGAIENGS